jgi:putative transposase
MRYRFIQAEKAAYPVEVLCRVLTVARSGYYAWCRRPIGARAQQNQWLVTHIQTCYRLHEAAMGVRGFIKICAPTGFGSAAIA